MPRAKPSPRYVVVNKEIRVGPRWAKATFSYKRILTTQEYAARERRKLLFNALAVPFSRRARFCLIRKARREVLFALRKKKQISQRSPGQGGTYRRRYVSEYAC